MRHAQRFLRIIRPGGGQCADGLFQHGRQPLRHPGVKTRQSDPALVAGIPGQDDLEVAVEDIERPLRLFLGGNLGSPTGRRLLRARLEAESRKPVGDRVQRQRQQADLGGSEGPERRCPQERQDTEIRPHIGKEQRDPALELVDRPERRRDARSPGRFRALALELVGEARHLPSVGVRAVERDEIAARPHARKGPARGGNDVENTRQDRIEGIRGGNDLVRCKRLTGAGGGAGLVPGVLKRTGVLGPPTSIGLFHDTFVTIPVLDYD